MYQVYLRNKKRSVKGFEDSEGNNVPLGLYYDEKEAEYYMNQWNSNHEFESMAFVREIK